MRLLAFLAAAEKLQKKKTKSFLDLVAAKDIVIKSGIIY